MSKKPYQHPDYFVRSGIREVSLLRKHFDIKGDAEAVRVAGRVHPKKIMSFFREFFGAVRPSSLRDDKILPEPDPSKLRAFYVGHPDANVLLNLIVRHSLYVDQILIVDPFLTLPHDDVLNRPQVWTEAVLNRALCLCALEDWIRSEIVVVIPSLFHYYPEIDEFIVAHHNELAPLLTVADHAKLSRWLKTKLLLTLAPEARDSAIDVFVSMGDVISDDDRTALHSEVEQFEATNPIRFRTSQEFYEHHFKDSESVGQVFDMSAGVPLFLAQTIAEITGAFLIFEHRMLYDVVDSGPIRESKASGALQELALAFQTLDFPFLHNVPLAKALELRKRGYLHSFRVFMRDLWKVVSDDDQTILNDRILEFSDRLKSEYSTLEAEWKRIKAELRAKAISSGVVVGLSAVAIGSISWSSGVIAGAGAGLIKEQLSGYLSISNQLHEARTSPLSVFLTLDEA